jgi:hypothetical protein
VSSRVRSQGSGSKMRSTPSPRRWRSSTRYRRRKTWRTQRWGRTFAKATARELSNAALETWNRACRSILRELMLTQLWRVPGDGQQTTRLRKEAARCLLNLAIAYDKVEVDEVVKPSTDPLRRWRRKRRFARIHVLTAAAVRLADVDAEAHEKFAEMRRSRAGGNTSTSRRPNCSTRYASTRTTPSTGRCWRTRRHCRFTRLSRGVNMPQRRRRRLSRRLRTLAMRPVHAPAKSPPCSRTSASARQAGADKGSIATPPSASGNAFPVRSG